MQPRLNTPEQESMLRSVSQLSRPFAIAGIGVAALAGGNTGVEVFGETKAYVQTNTPAKNFPLEPQTMFGSSGGPLCAEAALAPTDINAQYIFEDRLLSYDKRVLAKEFMTSYPNATINITRRVRTKDLQFSINDARPNLGKNEKSCANYGKRIIRFWQRIENDGGEMVLNSPVIKITPDDEATPQNPGAKRYREKGELNTLVHYTCQRGRDNNGKNNIRKWDIVGEKTWKPIHGEPQRSRRVTPAWRFDKKVC